MTVDRTELRHLHAAATPGPWKHTTSDTVKPGRFIEGADGWWQVCSIDPDCDKSQEDFDLIAAMHAALPVLLDRLDTYQEALTLLIEKAEQYFDTERGDLDGAVDFARAALDTEQT